jgi:acetylornithine deacetylase/succinyl-diaminopimelate desuccinylase-like protein
VQHGIRADAGIVAEPSSFDVWPACPGTLKLRATVPGRPDPTQMDHPHWKDGGAVNAIKTMMPVLDGIRLLREEWSRHSDCRYPLLAASDIVPTLIKSGTWEVGYPSWYSVTCNVQYLPAQGEDAGTGLRVKREGTERLTLAASADPWFRDHTLRFEWGWGAADRDQPGSPTPWARSGDRRPARPCGPRERHELISRRGQLHPVRWHALVLARPGRRAARAEDEYIEVDELVDDVAAVALIAIRFCGVS